MSARTLEDTHFLTIDREDFLKLIQENTVVSMKLILAITRSLSSKTQKNFELIDEYLAWRAERENQ